MKTVFVGDFHIKFREHAEDTERRLKVQSFLKSLVGNTSCLVLMGDVFDLWAEWHWLIIKNYFPLLKILADLKESGCRLVYLSGNHDFWFDGFLSETIGIEIFPDAFQAEFDGIKVFATHGDMYTSNDFRYHFFRKIVRYPLTKKVFMLIHPMLALKIGTFMSRSSRRAVIQQELGIKREEGMLNFAKSLLGKYQLVVMGHSHKPALLPIGNGYYGNSGDWLKNFSWLEIVDGEIRLKYYHKGE